MYQTKKAFKPVQLADSTAFDIKPDKFSGLIENNDLSSKKPLYHLGMT